MNTVIHREITVYKIVLLSIKCSVFVPDRDILVFSISINKNVLCLFQVETYWCFSIYMSKIQQDFTEDGMVRKIGKY